MGLNILLAGLAVLLVVVGIVSKVTDKLSFSLVFSLSPSQNWTKRRRIPPAPPKRKTPLKSVDIRKQARIQ